MAVWLIIPPLPLLSACISAAHKTLKTMRYVAVKPDECGYPNPLACFNERVFGQKIVQRTLGDFNFLKYDVRPISIGVGVNKSNVTYITLTLWKMNEFKSNECRWMNGWSNHNFAPSSSFWLLTPTLASNTILKIPHVYLPEFEIYFPVNKVSVMLCPSDQS